jgi:hypothetical protein
MVIEKSVRYSCANVQNPFSINNGYFVVMKATIITIKSGITANPTRILKQIKHPHIISTVPVKFAQNSGLENPILTNRPAPTTSGEMNFCNPSDKKINPTISLGIRVELVIKVFIQRFIK